MIVFSILLYYFVIIPISLLPFRVLYLVSDGLYLVLYRMVGYRTKVVRMNMKNSFPEKSAEELQKIERLFYHHLCDVMVETFKSFTISRKQILRRVVVQNPELIDAYYDQGRSVVLGGGHYNNWEWLAIGMDPQIRHHTVGLYTPLTNTYFDHKMQSTRSKFGLNMVSTQSTGHYFEESIGQLNATIFGIDQSPRDPVKSFWTEFLHQDTPVAFGFEKYAKEYNYPALFCNIDKFKRGYYGIRFSLVTDQPQSAPLGSIIDTTTKLLEKEINALPQYWLWTHRRWKHKREP